MIVDRLNNSGVIRPDYKLHLRKNAVEKSFVQPLFDDITDAVGY
jgi:hypothetical protein